jgi:hypothetical protein
MIERIGTVLQENSMNSCPLIEYSLKELIYFE